MDAQPHQAAKNFLKNLPKCKRNLKFCMATPYTPNHCCLTLLTTHKFET